MHMTREQRLHPREPIAIEGTAVAGNGLQRTQLRLVNLSRSGAMVETPGEAALPNELVLLFNHRSEPCRLIWQQGQLAGLQFMDQF
ncbi:MAG TPA: PilZ domain-containing protein [Devosia sp.]|jgi:hypothetical protein